MDNDKFITACQILIFNSLPEIDEISFDVEKGKCSFFSILSKNVKWPCSKWDYLRDQARELVNTHIKDNFIFIGESNYFEVILLKNGKIIIN